MSENRRDEQTGRSSALELDQIVFIGRTFEEYVRMFDLRPEELRGTSILDCPGGACSFTARACELGARAVAADIAYAFDLESLRLKGQADIDHTMRQLSKVSDGFRWEEHGSIDGLKVERLRALRASTDDMTNFPERYVSAVLPGLPFEDERFDLTLSAHFLFTYADQLDLDFHVCTLRELLRVTKGELRIFPTADRSGKRYSQMDELLASVADSGYSVSEVKTAYEFQSGAHTMLIIRK